MLRLVYEERLEFENNMVRLQQQEGGTIMKSDRFKNLAILVLACRHRAGCAPQIAVVSEKTPARFQGTSGTNQAIVKTIDRAQGLQRSQPWSPGSLRKRGA